MCNFGFCFFGNKYYNNIPKGANVAYAIRKECKKSVKEFALSNMTAATTFGQLSGTVTAMILARTVPDR